MYVPQSSRGSGSTADQPRVYQVWPGANVLFFGGRCICGADVRSLFLTIFLILAPVLVFCIFVAKHLSNDFPDHWGISVMVVVVVVTVYDLFLLLLTAGMDPGIVPRIGHPPETEPNDLNNDTGNGQTPQQLRFPHFPRVKEVYVNGVLVRVKYCDTCMLYRPPRCSHCSTCDNCVERFDHHSPCLGQCIGLRNYRFFYMFVFCTTLLCFYVFGFCWVYIIKIRDAQDSSIWKAMLKTPASMVLIIYCFIFVWPIGGRSVFHFYMISTNQTTWEMFSHPYGRQDNPHNRGIVNNFLEIFCTAVPASKNYFRARVPVEEGSE